MEERTLLGNKKRLLHVMVLLLTQKCKTCRGPEEGREGQLPLMPSPKGEFVLFAPLRRLREIDMHTPKSISLCLHFSYVTDRSLFITEVETEDGMVG